MPVDNMPRVTAEAKHQTLTLGELRELVEAAALHPPETIVRGGMVPFKRSDLGHPKGACLKTIALDRPES
ncbi:hypothetical protein C5E10_06290 [Pseudoclavibacter sp. RFBG4]|uniref:hypothetical protein n=1 Tax=Pseudoclavibacter sp. RFBG4 TaxID=2080575 RepID=UPI000CE7EEDF|nr:hypothetical protein [Pseudoclavibacter sp. RFBG4]PPG35197.1 hypothetical protein C5E10_06290 [Pseudoclavibacter sp. RFBG4]